ncbi:type II toxin-antitoxin system VapC family toxin [Sphingomonas rubra]|uniref:Predicted nucleic-acid-binding protein, contains PIN domain n=1 Tax=Sphingomonas rubra TaxID=634430 RepID=A0A1I5UCC1_9SPHN|nr:type II toxin-antitoxin system VapC family toxin [Sphingomonas rubra]SFP92963.1 Predicted nucleic-acid-binding protein, contains PIN domain [Sphingomonas rubra]
MIGADTNIVLRLVLDDDDRQVDAARRIMAEKRLVVPTTVMLEVGWVLASRYQMPRALLADTLETLMALDGLEIARTDLVGWAIDRFREGADWADMIHLVASSKFDGFLTFDKRLVRDAGYKAPVPIETLS